MIALLATALTLSGPTVLVLNGLDPIDLLEGKEIAGESRYSASFGRHEYRFCSAAHLSKFEKAPLKYAVQNGGACGKMGAMTGQGSPDRWHVANGLIFLFASDGCRDTFKSRVDDYFKPVDLSPVPTDDEFARANEIYKKMLAAHGGAGAVGKLRDVEWTYEIPYKEKGVAKIWKTKGAILDSEHYALWEQWDDGKSFFVRNGDKAVEGTMKGAYTIHPGEMREFTAAVVRNPVAILMGMAAPIKPAGGSGVVMSHANISFTVNLDPATSRISSITFVDRYSGPVSSVIVEYSDYVDVSGVAIPKTKRVMVGDEDWSKPSTITTVTAGQGQPAVFSEAIKIGRT